MYNQKYAVVLYFFFDVQEFGSLNCSNTNQNKLQMILTVYLYIWYYSFLLDHYDFVEKATSPNNAVPNDHGSISKLRLLFHGSDTAYLLDSIGNIEYHHQ